MAQLNQFTEEQAADAAQQYVSSEELVRALASIESRQMGEAADRVKIGDAIQQLGLDMTPEQVLAEVTAERERQSHAALKVSRRRRTVRTTLGIIGAVLLVTLLIQFLDARTATHRPRAAFGAAAAFSPEFDSLMQTFRANTFDEGKVAFVKVMAKGRTFRSDEVHEVMSEMTFDAGRLDAAEILYPRMADPQNAYKLLDTMTFDQGRKDLIARLGLDKPDGGRP